MMVIGLHARKAFTGRRNPQEPICSDEGSQLGKETAQTQAWPSKEKAIYWPTCARCNCKSVLIMWLDDQVIEPLTYPFRLPPAFIAIKHYGL
jgi:hypothetical protein